MTKKLLLSVSVALMLAACQGAENTAKDAAGKAKDAASKMAKVDLPDGVTLVESVKRKGDEVVIPYNKYKLDNGLTVVLHQDKSDPLVHVDVTYHVGSGREDIGKSGFAHFFEHMLFQGSKNVKDEQHFALITESGGTLNGSTNGDRTNYYETVPSNQLEKMLWLEADRMGYFLNGPAVGDKAFEVQRETVKNERGQRVDNQPYGLLFERVGEAMFPEGHPYSWSTIGYLEDLDRADINDLKRFFLRWYGPNNATLTIGGDLDETQTLAWIQKYFAPIPTGPEVSNPEYVPVTLNEDRYISLEDKNARLPLLFMSWPTVHANHPDEAPLDVLQNIMGGGQTSLLYKNLEKPGLTVQASAGHACREISCSFTLFALANPARVQKLADMEKVIRESLIEFEERGVQDDDLTRVKASIVSGMVYGLESVRGKITQLAAYQTYRDNPNGIGDDIARYENVTKADVMRVYDQYIKGKSAVVMSIVPEGAKGAIAKPDTWQRYERTLPPETEAEPFEWEPPVDNFDRSIIPPAGANPSIKAPDVYNASINEIPVLGTINNEVPTTTISVRIKTGQMHEPMNKLGLAALTAAMVDESTASMSVEEISNELAKLGSSYSWSSGDTYTTLRIRSLTKNLDKTVELAVKSLMEPKFDSADFDRNKANTLQGIRQAKKQPAQTASDVFNKMMYGTDNNFAYSSAGTEETLPNITLDDVRTFYEANYSPKAASIIAVSDLGEAALTKALAPLKAWEGDDLPSVETKAFPELNGKTVYFVDQPGAPQSEIRIGKRALPYDATGEYYKSGVMNFMLGGAFNSRINLNLREDKGYTYGARSFFNGDETRGWYRAGAGVRADSTAASIKEFASEISKYHAEGITPEELEFTKAAMGQRDARAYETPGQKLGFLGRMMTYNLKPSFVDDQADILQGMSKADIDTLAAKHLNLDDMIMVVVGDKAKYKSEIEALGYTVVDMDADGKMLK